MYIMLFFLLQGLNELLKDFFKRDMKTIVCNARVGWKYLVDLETNELMCYIWAYEDDVGENGADNRYNEEDK